MMKFLSLCIIENKVSQQLTGLSWPCNYVYVELIRFFFDIMTLTKKKTHLIDRIKWIIWTFKNTIRSQRYITTGIFSLGNTRGIWTKYTDDIGTPWEPWPVWVFIESTEHEEELFTGASYVRSSFPCILKGPWSLGKSAEIFTRHVEALRTASNGWRCHWLCFSELHGPSFFNWLLL